MLGYHLRKTLLVLFIFALPAFAISPFSLEGFKEGNFKLFDKSKMLSEQMKKKISQEFEKQLSSVGIQTTSENFSNFLVKIEASKINDTYVVNLALFIVENIHPTRNNELESLGITYRKDDFFETNDFEKEVYDSLVNYLLFDFIEQYKEENDL